VTLALQHRDMACEVRAAGRGLQGHAVLWNVETSIGAGREIVRPYATRASLASGADILALVDHDAKRVLGRTKSGTLRLEEDSKGLAFEIDLPETTFARDVLALAERGDLGGMSFGFVIPKGGDAWEGNRRELRAIDLREISVVSAWPAYKGTTVTARSAPTPSPMARYVRLMMGGGTWG
jgi:HK97 family phage prohead protease